MKCYISKNYRHLSNAGDKAKTDIEAVMDRLGYTNLGLPQGRVKGTVKGYFITLASTLKGVSRLRKGDVLVLQYPLKKYYDFVVKTARRRGVKVITVIHDLGSFRRKKLTVEEEVARLNMSAVVIVHSEPMRRWLSAHGVSVPMVVLGLFDYLSDSKTRSRVCKSSRPKLMFAGSLSPANNGWIYKLADEQPSVDLVLYGGDFDMKKCRQNLIVKGFMPSDELISAVEGEFGIVWYGNSLDDGAGPLGDYLRYNAPHKTSLYLRAGIPVVIWEKAALAETVKRLGVGLCVPSLRNMEKVLAGVSAEDYVRMRENAAVVAAKLASGGFITEALEEAEKYC